MNINAQTLLRVQEVLHNNARVLRTLSFSTCLPAPQNKPGTVDFTSLGTPGRPFREVYALVSYYFNGFPNHTLPATEIDWFTSSTDTAYCFPVAISVSKLDSIFGTDNPIPTLIEPTRTWIQLLKDLPAKAPEGITFKEEEVDAILGGNAASILGLDGK